MVMKGETPDLECHPLTPERWGDFETLFGPKGAYGGCWCMWPRLRSKDFRGKSGAQNKQAMRDAVDSGEEPGLLAYGGGEPIGWVALAPRERYALLEHSRTLKRVDDRPVWSIVCFVIDKRARGRGMMAKLLSAAVDYAARHGATIVEAYPVEPAGKLTGYSGFTGIASTFRRAGFVEVRASQQQPVMRYYVGGAQ